MTDKQYNAAKEKYVEITGEDPKFTILNEDNEEVELDTRTVIEDWFDGINHLEDLHAARSQYDPLEDMISYS